MTRHYQCRAATARYMECHDLKDLPEHILKEITYIFETYKVLEGKTVKVLGWEGAQAKIGDHTRPEAVRWEGPLSLTIGGPLRLLTLDCRRA